MDRIGRLDESNRTLLKILRGEATTEDLPDHDPGYFCRRCRDTGFLVVESLYGQASSKRCPFCKEHFDKAHVAEARKGEREIPPDTLEEPPPDIPLDKGEAWWEK